MKIERIYGASVIGRCLTCGKQFEDYLKPREGYNHARSTGHTVSMEITSNFRYN